MRRGNDFRDADLTKGLIKAITAKLLDVSADRVRIMEVCGTHTVAIFRNGIRSTLPKQLKLLSGPGCPVCVTDQSYIDIVLQIADRDDCIIAT